MNKPLLEVLRDVTLDPSEQAAFAADPSEYLSRYGYEEVSPDDLAEAFSLVADTLPPEAAQATTSGVLADAYAPSSSAPGFGEGVEEAVEAVDLAAFGEGHVEAIPDVDEGFDFGAGVSGEPAAPDLGTSDSELDVDDDVAVDFGGGDLFAADEPDLPEPEGLHDALDVDDAGGVGPDFDDPADGGIDDIGAF